MLAELGLFPAGGRHAPIGVVAGTRSRSDDHIQAGNRHEADRAGNGCPDRGKRQAVASGHHRAGKVADIDNRAGHGSRGNRPMIGTGRRTSHSFAHAGRDGQATDLAGRVRHGHLGEVVVTTPSRWYHQTDRTVATSGAARIGKCAHPSRVESVAVPLWLRLGNCATRAYGNPREQVSPIRCSAHDGCTAIGTLTTDCQRLHCNAHKPPKASRPATSTQR